MATVKVTASTAWDRISDSAHVNDSVAMVVMIPVATHQVHVLVPAPVLASAHAPDPVPDRASDAEEAPKTEKMEKTAQADAVAETEKEMTKIQNKLLNAVADVKKRNDKKLTWSKS